MGIIGELLRTSPTLLFMRAGARGALIGLLPVLLAAQTPATGAIAGRVTTRADTGAPAPAHGALISIAGVPLRATTGADGRFDTVDWFSGEIRGDTIVGGYYLAGGPMHFVRQR